MVAGFADDADIEDLQADGAGVDALFEEFEVGLVVIEADPEAESRVEISDGGEGVEVIGAAVEDDHPAEAEGLCPGEEGVEHAEDGVAVVDVPAVGVAVDDVLFGGQVLATPAGGEGVVGGVAFGDVGGVKGLAIRLGGHGHLLSNNNSVRSGCRTPNAFSNT